MTTKPKAVAELSFNTLLTRNEALLKVLAPLVYDGLVAYDAAKKLLGIEAYLEGLQRNEINQSLYAVMVDFATGTDLDNLASFYGIERKQVEDEEGNIVEESDDELRERIKEAPYGFSVAGPESSYIYFGKLSDPEVKDISAVSPNPCEVEITVLSMLGNGTASIDLVSKVSKTLNADDIRPMGDQVTAKGAEVIEYEIDVQITPQTNTPEASIDLEQIKANLQEYSDSEHRLGGIVVQSGIYASSHIEGVERVEIISPSTEIICNPAQAPFCTKVVASFSTSATKKGVKK